MRSPTIRAERRFDARANLGHLRDRAFVVREQLPEEDRALSIAEVCRRLDISASTFFRLRQLGRFPIPEIEPRLTRGPKFRLSAVWAYLQGQCAPRVTVPRVKRSA